MLYQVAVRPSTSPYIKPDKATQDEESHMWAEESETAFASTFRRRPNYTTVGYIQRGA